MYRLSLIFGVRRSAAGGFRAAWVVLALLLLQGTSLAQTPARIADDPPVASPLFKSVISNEEQCERKLDEYERMMRTEGRKSGSDANTVETKVWRMFPIGTGWYKIPMPADGPPVADTYRNDLEKIEKYLVWLTQEASGPREAYAKAERKRKERFDLLEATNQAFIFTRDGEEQRDGRTLLRYTIAPNPKYRPTSRNTTLFTHVKGTIWIDEQSSQMAKIDGTVTEDISLALFLAKVYKGSHFMQERYEVAPGIWGPTFEQYDFDGRKFLYGFSIHERTFYSDYKHVGPPKDAVEVVRAELNKARPEASSH